MSTVRLDLKYVLAFGQGEASDRSLEGYAPRDPDDFGFDAWIYIGTEDSDGSQLFDLVVCSPTWLARELASGRWMARFAHDDVVTGDRSVVPNPDVWLMQRWNRTKFEDALRSLFNRCSPAPDWETVADRLGRYLVWEYDYRYDQTVNERHGLPHPPM